MDKPIILYIYPANPPQDNRKEPKTPSNAMMKIKKADHAR